RLCAYSCPYLTSHGSKFSPQISFGRRRRSFFILPFPFYSVQHIHQAQGVFRRRVLSDGGYGFLRLLMYLDVVDSLLVSEFFILDRLVVFSLYLLFFCRTNFFRDSSLLVLAVNL